MGDAVDGGNAHLGKVRVTEFNGIGEHRGFGGAVHDVKAAVVVEGRAGAEVATGLKVPRLASVGLVVD